MKYLQPSIFLTFTSTERAHVLQAALWALEREDACHHLDQLSEEERVRLVERLKGMLGVGG